MRTFVSIVALVVSVLPLAGCQSASRPMEDWADRPSIDAIMVELENGEKKWFEHSFYFADGKSFMIAEIPKNTQSVFLHNKDFDGHVYSEVVFVAKPGDKPEKLKSALGWKVSSSESGATVYLKPLKLVPEVNQKSDDI